VIALEPKPGVPPSSGYLAQVLEVLKKQAGEDDHPRRLRGPARPSRVRRPARRAWPAVMLPYTIGGSDQAKGPSISLYDDTLKSHA